MGKQSSRIYYRGKDHKDIYFQRKFHTKMYVGNKIVWEKLLPEKFLVTQTSAENSLFLIYDIQRKLFDVMPFNGENNMFSVWKHVGNSMFINISGKAYFSTDIYKFQTVNNNYVSNTSIGIEDHYSYTDNCTSYEFFDSNKTEHHMVIKYNTNDKSIKFNEVELNNLNLGSSVTGYGKYLYYRFYSSGKSGIYVVDENAKKIKEIEIKNRNSMDIGSFYAVDDILYVTGSHKSGDIFSIGRVDKESGIVEWRDIETDDEQNMFRHSFPIFLDKKEIVFLTSIQEDGIMYVFSLNKEGLSVKNKITNGVVSVKTKDNKTINFKIPESLDTSFYIQDSVIQGPDLSKGVLLSTAHVDGMSVINCFYFNNPYFLESDGNIGFIYEREVT